MVLKVPKGSCKHNSQVVHNVRTSDMCNASHMHAHGKRDDCATALSGWPAPSACKNWEDYTTGSCSNIRQPHSTGHDHDVAI